MSIGRLDRLSRYLVVKYSTTNLNEVRNSLGEFYLNWLVGNPRQGVKVPDQTIIAWSQMGSGREFDLIKELLFLVKNIGEGSGKLSEGELYSKVSRAMNISQVLKDKIITAIKEEIIKATPGIRKVGPNGINELNRREGKIRTFLRMLDSVYEKARSSLGKAIPAEEKSQIDAEQLALLEEGESVGHYEDQKPMPVSDEQLNLFIKTPEAQKYKFDNGDILRELLIDPEFGPKVHTLVRSVKRGHNPKDAPEVEARAKELRALLDQRDNTNQPYFEAGEDEAKEFARPKFVDPAELRKQRLIEEEKLEEAEQKFRDLQQQVQKRDEAHQKRQLEEQQMEEDRQRHIRSEGAALLKALIKKRYL